MTDNSSNGIQSLTASYKPHSKTLTRSPFENTSADKSRWRLSLGNAPKFMKLPDHDITHPITFNSDTNPVPSIRKYANIDDFSKSDFSEPSPKIYDKTDFKVNPKRGVPLPPLPVASVDDPARLAIQQTTKKPDRSLMPLPPTPLDVVVANDIQTLASAKGGDTSEDKMKEGSTDDMPIEECTSSSDENKRIDFGLHEKSPSELPLSTTNSMAATVDGVTTVNSNGENRVTTNKELRHNEQLENVQNNAPVTVSSSTLTTIEIVPVSTTVSNNKGAAIDNATTICSDEDYVISDYEFYSMQKQRQKSLITGKVSTNDVSEYLELKCLNPALGNYVIMHRVDHPSLKTDSQAYAYDYIYHSYVEMCKCKLRQSGVPPRKVKRVGYTPSVSIDTDVENRHATYVNIKELHGATLLPPPRAHHASDVDIPKSLPEQQSDFKVPPRNISRPKCYLSAPPAIPL